MRFSIGRILTAAIAVIVLTLTIILFISIRQSQRVRDTSLSVAKTELLVRHLQDLVFHVLDNETGARGYIITGNDKFLEPLISSETNLNRELAESAALIPDSATRQFMIDSITLLVRSRIAFSRQMINTYRNDGPQAAAALVLSGKGKYYTDRIRSAVEKTQADQNLLLEQRKQSNERSITILNYILYGILAFALALGLLATQRIRTDMSRQKAIEHRFSSLLDAAPDATVIVNEKGLIQMVNIQTENLFGYRRSEIIGQPVEIMLPKELRSRHIHHRSGFVKDAKVRPMGAGIELNAVKKDGSSFPVEISLSPIQTDDGMVVSASIRDITTRKKSEAKFRSLLDSAPDATVIVDEQGIIQMVNHQTERLFEYMRNELIGKPVEILIPAEIRSKHVGHRAEFSSMPRVRSMGAGLELNAVKKNGARFPVEISLSPIETEEGMLISASVRDITARKVLEDELRKSNSEMEAFTYSVSHDLRAPLRAIIGFTAILEEDYTSKLDNEAKRITNVIRNNTLKMGHLIDDLLAFSRTGKQELVKMRIDALTMVREVIEELTQQNRANDSIQWDIKPLPEISADRNTIRQVWINLISNAIKYSSHRPDPRIEIGSFMQEAQEVFYVADNGVGFDEQYKHKLFKVFQRLHSAEDFEGTGVGLALVEKIVFRHGGKAWAEGRENVGATFYFSLPVTKHNN